MNIRGQYFLIGVSSVVFASLLIYAGCSSDGEPEPFDCAVSDLVLQVLPTDIDNPASCNDTGTITATATGGKAPLTYSLNNSTTFQSSPVFSGLGPGSYSITVKDGNNCTKSVSGITLAAPDSPDVDAPVTQPDTECDSDNGSITVTASGGSGNFTYAIGGGSFQASNVFENLRAGNYVVSVKDELDCIVTVNATVPSGTGVDYDNDILPIFRSKCEFSGCHPTNGNWFDYSVASANAQKIKTRTGSKEMPLGGASAPGGALSDEQIALIACWVDHGAPKN